MHTNEKYIAVNIETKYWFLPPWFMPAPRHEARVPPMREDRHSKAFSCSFRLLERQKDGDWRLHVAESLAVRGRKEGGGVQRRFDQAKGQRGNTSRWPLEAAGSEEGKQAIDSLGLRRLGRSDCRQQIAGAAAGEYRESASPCTMSDGGCGGVLVSLSCIYSWMSCYGYIHVHDLSLSVFFWYQPLFPVPLAKCRYSSIYLCSTVSIM